MALRSPVRASEAAAAGRGRPPLDPRAILTSIGEAVYDWDLATDAITWSSNAAEVFDLADLGLIATGKAFSLAVEPDSGRTRHDAIFGSTEADDGVGVPYRAACALRLGKRLLRIEDTGRWYADAEGRAAFAHGTVRISRLAPDAPAPGGARERSQFLEELQRDIGEGGRIRRPVTLFAIALDELGRLNEDLGYEAADAVIGEVARRVGRVMRRRDRSVRYAGNRFAVALLSCPAEQAEVAARRMSQEVEAEPIDTPRGPVGVRVKIGAASAPEHAGDAASLLRCAEDALLYAKRTLGRSYILYDPGQTRAAPPTIRGTAAIDVVDALNSRRVVFARQPVVEAASRQPAFHEALARLRDPSGRMIAASDILPAVERSGLTPLLDTRILELAAEHLAGCPESRLSINVSPLTLESATWLSTLAAHLGARPGIASRLIVEVTETVAVRDPEATRTRLDAMKALGVAVAIDDFGAGHTSFRHLRNFPVDLLKIDGAFIQNLARSPDDRFFVRTLVDLAHNLNIATVAEWVEDEETARLLAEWGVDYLQGKLCGPPILAEAPAPAAKVA
jgi:diguanylate cyclase (GGDEF)-like protein